jgi:hypothetical protein
MSQAVPKKISEVVSHQKVSVLVSLILKIQNPAPIVEMLIAMPIPHTR